MEAEPLDRVGRNGGLLIAARMCVRAAYCGSWKYHAMQRLPNLYEVVFPVVLAGGVLAPLSIGTDETIPLVSLGFIWEGNRC